MTGKENMIKNHELYKDFYKRLDILDCEFIKVKGHKKVSVKDEPDEILLSLIEPQERLLGKLFCK